MIAVGIDLPSSRLAVEYATRFAEISAAIGIHPHDAREVGDDAISELEKLALSSPEVVAIGETGLDYYRDRAPREIQKTAFLGQIELARKAGSALDSPFQAG